MSIAGDATRLEAVAAEQAATSGGKASGLAGALFAAASLIGTLALTFLGLTAVTFFIGRFMAVDPVLAVVGDRATREVYEKAKIAMGLDRSVPEQFLIYLKKVLSGDLGNSVITSHPVLSDLLHFFPATFELATIATLIGVVIG